MRGRGGVALPISGRALSGKRAEVALMRRDRLNWAVGASREVEDRPCH
jgi:hypothetical protein